MFQTTFALFKKHLSHAPVTNYHKVTFRKNGGTHLQMFVLSWESIYFLLLAEWMGLKRKLYSKDDLVLTILSIFPTEYALASPAKNWKNDFYENSKTYLQNWNPQGWADWISLCHFIVWSRICRYLKGIKFRDWKKQYFTGI